MSLTGRSRPQPSIAMAARVDVEDTIVVYENLPFDLDEARTDQNWPETAVILLMAERASDGNVHLRDRHRKEKGDESGHDQRERVRDDSNDPARYELRVARPEEVSPNDARIPANS
jgi:hypothetical protein